MPLPLQLCDAGHQAIAFLGDCPLCCGKGWEKRTISRQLSVVTFQAQLEQALRERYAQAQ